MRVGIIGAGFMGAIHAQVYRDLPHTELVAVTDLDPARARRAAGGSDCAVFSDYHEMFAQSALDVVSICTKDDLHREPALAAAAAGVHIMLEKPIAATLEDAAAISRAAHAAGVRLGVGYLLRFDPRYALARQALQDGRLGELTHVTAKRSSPHTEGPSRYGGSLPLALHVTVHDLDLIYWLTGKKVRRVYAQAATKLLGGSGTEDSVFAILTLEDGVVANLESSWALPSTSEDETRRPPHAARYPRPRRGRLWQIRPLPGGRGGRRLPRHPALAGDRRAGPRGHQRRAYWFYGGRPDGFGHRGRRRGGDRIAEGGAGDHRIEPRGNGHCVMKTPHPSRASPASQPVGSGRVK